MQHRTQRERARVSQGLGRIIDPPQHSSDRSHKTQRELAIASPRNRKTWKSAGRVLAYGVGMLGVLVVGACDNEPTALDGDASYQQVSMPGVVIAVGQQEQLATPPEINSTSSFRWESSSNSVATVSKNGVITGMSPGEATITAKAKRQRASWTVTVAEQVVAPAVATIVVTPATADLLVNSTAQLAAEARDENGNVIADAAFTWESATPAVATVSESGLVTAVAAGTAEIRVHSGGQTASAAVTVNQQPAVLTAVEVTPATATVQAGATTQLTATAKDQNGAAMAGATFTWSSANPAIATVSETGVVSGVAAGEVAIAANSGGVPASAIVTVTAPAAPPPPAPPPPAPAPAVLTSITVSPTTATVQTGATAQLEAVAKDQNGNTMSGVTFTWSSANPSIATVSTSGLVTGVAAGQAAITATSGDKSGTSQATVTAAPAPPPTVSGSGAAPIHRGIWISKAELDALPMSGTAWTGTGEVKQTADAAWAVQGVEVYDGQKYAQSVMAGALVFARMYPDPAAEAYRTKVVQAIRNVMGLPDDLASNITGVNRFIGTWAIIADLINLPAHDAALDTQFRAWLNHKLDMKLESSGKTVRTQINHSNNHGSHATFSLAAVAAYLGDRATLDLIAQRYRRWLGNTSVGYAIKWTSESEQATWQLNPTNPATWVGILPKGATRDGHNFDGIQPSDQMRGTAATYDAASFPNDHSSVRYNETSLIGVTGALLILHRAGYTDLMNASDQAVLRAAKWIKYAADNYGAKGYVYFTGPLEAARPLINYFYPTAGLPAPRERSQLSGSNYGFTWTYWTHAGRSVR